MKRVWLLGLVACSVVAACDDDETTAAPSTSSSGGSGGAGANAVDGTGGAPEWVQSLDVSAPRALMVDGEEAVLVGTFSNEANIGGSAFTSSGNADIFVIRFDAMGGIIWARQYGANSVEDARSAALDSQGNIVITGWFEDTTDFGDGPLVGSSGKDIFVAKLDSQGAIIWSRAFGGLNSDSARALAIDDQDAIYFTGQLGADVDAPIDFGGGPLPGASRDVFVAKLDSDGNHLMSRRFVSDDDADAFGIAVGADGSIIITGTFSGVIDYGGGAYSAIDYEDGFLLKLDASGTHVASMRFGGPGDDFGSAVAITPNGDVILAGSFDNTLELVTPAFETTGTSDGFVARLDTSLQSIWAMPLRGEGTTEAHSLGLDSAGNILVSGTFRDLGDFGGESRIAGAGNNDVFVVKFDGNGGHLWARKIGGESFEEQDALAIGDSDAPFITGNFRSNIDIGGEMFPGQSDITRTFVAKLMP